MRISILAPPLDPSINWPRDLRAATFVLCEKINEITHDISCADVEAISNWRERKNLRKCIDRWETQRRKLRRFFDSQVFADIKARP